MQIIEDTVSNSKLQWRVKHDIGVPFSGTYPNITYYYEATLTTSPSLNIKGSSDKAPNHEFYVAVQNSDDIRPLFDYNVTYPVEFFLLTPGTPQTYFNVTL